MISSPHIVIIPDIHGRDFWREAVHPSGKDRHYVFLGDYMDPYDDDGISWDDAFKGLLDVIAMKREHPETVTLLLGNHDLHYLFSELNGSRKNLDKAGIIRDTLERNLSCFRMAEETELAGQRVLFTHAGVNRDWVWSHRALFGPEGKISAETFNSLMFTPEFIRALSDISRWRGGEDCAGSMVWEDARAFRSETALLQGFIQIFGHTMQHDTACVFQGRIICADCQKVFLLEEYDSRPLFADLPWKLHPILL